jgi:uncharacterized damage-inducible protein DinB
VISADLLRDAFGRIQDTVHEVLEDLAPEELARRPDGVGNSIGWLIWHLTRVQDDHVAELAEREQAWTADGWSGRFGLPFAASATGYRHTSAQVDAVAGAAPDLLAGYHDAVCARTVDYLAELRDSDYDRVVDQRWDPPVTLGVRLISVIADDLQHAGQAAYVRGLLVGRRAGRG